MNNFLNENVFEVYFSNAFDYEAISLFTVKWNLNHNFYCWLLSGLTLHYGCLGGVVPEY